MKALEESIRSRRSVRTYDPRPLSAQDREALCAYMEKIENPYGLPVEFRLLEGMGSPVVVGTDLFVAGKTEKNTHMNEAFGYSFEKLVLYAEAMGIGTVWIGGTMDRGAFEKAMALNANEVMPCVSPLGYPAKKMSLRETMMRKTVKANERLPFEQIAFRGNFNEPMDESEAGELRLPLEMVRLAPSAINKQPWRMVVCDDMVHFYIKRSKGFGSGEIDMQKIDMGIALCHFEMMAREMGLEPEFVIAEPEMSGKGEMAYIASYRYKQ